MTSKEFPASFLLKILLAPLFSSLQKVKEVGNLNLVIVKSLVPN